MRVALYTRISTDEDRQPFSLEAQEKRLRSYIASQEDWHLAGAPYADQASGATLDRPKLNKMLTAARAGRFDVVLVYRVDRVARTLRGLVKLLDDQDKAGVVFRSATEPFDTSTPAGRMMVQMLGVFAEFERATIIDRITAGMERKAARGEWQNGRRPHGYVVDKSTGHLIVNELEAPQVTAIFDLYANQRLGAAAIGTLLSERGHRTQTGKPWNPRAVLTVLRNRVYLGEIYYKGIWNTGKTGPFHPPLIDPDLFDQAQQVLESRGEYRTKRTGAASDYLLAGLMTCARCGKRYLGNAAHGRHGGRFRYYTCYTRVRYGATHCDGDRLRADDLEHAVREALLRTYARTDLINAAVAAITTRSADQRDQLEADLAAVRGEITAAEQTIDRYLLAFEKGTMPEKQCGARIEALAASIVELRDREADLTDQLTQPAPVAPTADLLDEVRAYIRDVFNDDRPENTKAILASLIDHITVYDRTRIKPVFRVPLQDATNPALTTQDGVREMSASVELTGFEPRTVSDPFSRLIGELLNVAPFMDPSTLESLRRLLSDLVAPTPFCPKTAAHSGGER
jgi:site-specific DNA recombinase